MKHVYLRILITFIFFLPFSASHAQGFGLPVGFDLKTFQKNEDLAMWFLQYDSAYQNVASFDHITGSKDFICIPDKKGWKVVVGTVDSSGFKADASYYTVDPKKMVTLSKKKFDTLLVASMGRALFNSKQAITKANIKAPAGWNFFTKINDDKGIVVWAFCDADASGIVWYGPECAYYYFSDGRKLSTSKVVNKAPLMVGKVGTTMNLTCPTDKMPTVGAIWLARKYMMSFPEINVSYKTGTSTLRYNASEKSYAWEHLAN